MTQTIDHYWSRLADRHDAAALPALRAAYAEPHRAYHALRHIDELLSKLAEREALATRPDLVAAAVFWHDSVYQTRASDGRPRPDALSVSDSLALFRNHAAFPQQDAEAVADMIMATAAHGKADATREIYSGFSKDLDLFLDLDLSPLAAPWPEFSQNLDDIRFEYSWVPEADFSAARLEMLAGLARADGSLYRRPECAAVWEQPARANIARVIAELQTRMKRAARG